MLSQSFQVTKRVTLLLLTKSVMLDTIGQTINFHVSVLERVAPIVMGIIWILRRITNARHKRPLKRTTLPPRLLVTYLFIIGQYHNS